MKILLLLLLSLFLHADIVYNGHCGSYEYNLSIATKKYYGCMCQDNRLLVYREQKTPYIRAIYNDIAVSTSLDIYNIQNGRVYDSYDFNEGDIKMYDNTRDYYELLFAVSGLIVGTLVLFFVLKGFA